jgi:hypothetical protein
MKFESLPKVADVKSETCMGSLFLLGVGRDGDSLRSGDRIPEGARFSAPVQADPGTNPAYCTMGTGYIPGVRRPGRGVGRPPPSSVEVKEGVELYIYSPNWVFMACSRVPLETVFEVFFLAHTLADR